MEEEKLEQLNSKIEELKEKAEKATKKTYSSKEVIPKKLAANEVLKEVQKAKNMSFALVFGCPICAALAAANAWVGNGVALLVGLGSIYFLVTSHNKTQYLKKEYNI